MPAQREKFPALCPDFVVELRSPSDALEDQSGGDGRVGGERARLGWLIDPMSKRVWVDAGNEAAVCHEAPETMSGERVLVGFVLEMSRVW